MDRADPKIDMSLDDVIMTSRPSRPSGRRPQNNRRDRDYRPNPRSSARVMDPASGRISIDSTRIRLPFDSQEDREDRISSSLTVSNLHHEVSSEDIQVRLVLHS